LLKVPGALNCKGLIDPMHEAQSASVRLIEVKLTFLCTCRVIFLYFRSAMYTTMHDLFLNPR
jgi:hypothetical protein